MAQPHKLVSVVIATYNNAEFLPLAVQSVLEQTYPHLEIQIVDDGSTDGSREALEPLLADPRVHYYYQPNQGQARAKNKGISEAKGEYIAFLDSDDLWMPKKLEKQLPLFESSASVGLVYAFATYINEAGGLIPTPALRSHRGRVSARLLVENFVPYVTAVARRECFERMGVFDESLAMAIDYDLWLRFSTKYSFECLEEPTAYYRVWSRQMSNNQKTRFECATRVMQKFAGEHPDLIDEKTIREAWAVAYAGRGYCLARTRSKRFEALRNFVFALRFRPTYPLAWKEILKLLLTPVLGRRLYATTFPHTSS